MSKCCIFGVEFVDDIRDSCNPDPLKDENGKFLADDPSYNRCCQHCNNVYVTPYRICKYYKEEKQCELIQARVLELRKGWLKK